MQICKGQEKRGSYKKVKLYDVLSKYRKCGRLRDMYTALSEFCETNNEIAEDVLFSMLLTTLKDSGKTELAKKVEYLWTEPFLQLLQTNFPFGISFKPEQN